MGAGGRNESSRDSATPWEIADTAIKPQRVALPPKSCNRGMKAGVRVA